MKSNQRDDKIAGTLSLPSTSDSIQKNKLKFTAGVFFLTAICILFEYIHGGVVSHHLLAREDLPSFSNWWGLLTVPLVSWIVISLIERRAKKDTCNKINILKRFLIGLGFGAILSLLWEFNLEKILQYLIFLPFIIAFFKPIHLPEYYMGFVLGMLFTFGGVLPVLIGLILLVVCFIINKLIRSLKVFIFSKTAEKN